MLGSDAAAAKRRDHRAAHGGGATAAHGAGATAATSGPGGSRDEVVDRLNQLTSEVQERQQFLDGMRAAGASKAHEGPIAAEIAVRLRELQQLVERASGGE